jgi:flagellar hook-length control protein FliK
VAQPGGVSAATPGSPTLGTTTAAPTTPLTADASAATTTKATVQGDSDAVATSAKQTVAQPNANAAGNPPLSAVIEVTAPVATKTASAKATATVEAKAATSSTSGTSDASGDSAPTASTTPVPNVATLQSAISAKPAAATAASDAATPNLSGAASLPLAATGHDRAGATPAPATSFDASLQATGAPAPQLPSSSVGTASTANFSATAATDAPVPVSGLAVEIAASVKSGKTSFEVRLDPADLGRIDVRIDVDRSGQVTSHLTVEKPETLSMLQQDAPQLQRALDDAGLKTGNGGLQFSLRDQSSSGQNNGNQTADNAQRLVISSDDTIPAVVAGRSYGRMLGASGGVDIRV